MALRGNKVVMFLCDIQTALNKVSNIEAVTQAACRLTAASAILDIPLVVTEQYPKGLGHTIEQIDISHGKVFEKTKFSGLTDEVQEHITSLHGGEVSDVILFGLEAHICVQQTCLEFLKSGVYNVHVIADATSSRMHADRMFAFETIRQAGGYVTTSESILFALLQHSRHPKFKEVQKLIIEPLPDQGMFPKL